jgi:hypothetical protein
LEEPQLMASRLGGKRRAQRIGGQPNSGMRALVVHHRMEHGPLNTKSVFYLPGFADEIVDWVEAGGPFIVSSGFLWDVLYTNGLPTEPYGFGEPLDARYWLVDERDGFEEWTEPHPVADDGISDGCGLVGFCPVEWEPHELAAGRGR